MNTLTASEKQTLIILCNNEIVTEEAEDEQTAVENIARLEEIIEKLSSPEPTVEESIENAKQLLREKGLLVDTNWSTNDVISRAEEYGYPELTFEQALEVLDIVEKNFDASVGISWDSIDDALDEYYGK